MAKFEFSEWLVEWLGKSDPMEFQWDVGNSSKSRLKYGVSGDEAEEIFRSDVR